MPGSLTTPGRPGARADAPECVAFHPLHGVGTQNRKLSRLNGWPMRPPVNASPRPSRATAHDSGPMWFANPSSQGTCILYSLPVSRRFANVFRFAPESGPPICALMSTRPKPGLAMGAPKSIKAVAIKEQIARERQAEIDAVIAEFGGDTDAATALTGMAQALLHYRHCLRQLADAGEMIREGRPFIVMGAGHGSNWKPDPWQQWPGD
jgi:hypothetical protein